MDSVLIIACGALAHELVAVKKANGLDNLRIQCLPAELHNRPEKIPAAVEAILEKTTGQFSQRFVAYADCGTGGLLDKVLRQYQVERLPGAHCYAFFSGLATFDAMQEEELGTFYLTDFLARHFERMVWQGMGMAKHPELRDMYFGSYKRVLFLVQQPEKARYDLAEQAAERLQLPLEIHHTGLAGIESHVVHFHHQWSAS